MEHANSENGGGCCSKCGRTTAFIIAIVATFLLMAFLVKQMAQRTAPAPVNAERMAARAKDNAEIRGAGDEALKSWGFVAEPATAKPAGIVRTPIEEAMKATIKGYQDPAAFRTDLLARSEKANTKPSYE